MSREKSTQPSRSPTRYSKKPLDMYKSIVRNLYAHTKRESEAHDDGIGSGFFSYPTPERALNSLCGLMLNDQNKADSKRINPKERQKAARQVLNEFLEELPN